MGGGDLCGEVTLGADLRACDIISAMNIDINHALIVALVGGFFIGAVAATGVMWFLFQRGIIK